MPVARPCVRLGILVIDGASYSAAHQPSRVSPGRGGSAAIRNYRARALSRDGHRCRWLLPDGSRCAVSENPEVHHVRPLADGGGHGLPNLLTTCRAHHAELERQLRRRSPSHA